MEKKNWKVLNTEQKEAEGSKGGVDPGNYK